MISKKAGKAIAKMLWLRKALLKIESTIPAVFSLVKIIGKLNNRIKYCFNKKGLERFEYVDFCV